METRYGVIKTFRFAIAGISGFGVTEAVLAIGLLALYGKVTFPHESFSSPVLLALDFISLVVGVSASFLINEKITVHVQRVDGKPVESRPIRYLKFQGVSAIGNIGIIVVQLLLLTALDISPLVGAIIGAIATYPIVYYISIRLVWTAHQLR